MNPVDYAAFCEDFAGSFTLTLPRKVVFGWGRLREAPEHTVALGRRILLVIGKRSAETLGIRDRLVAPLERAGAEVVIHRGPGREPEVGDVDELVAASSHWKPEVVVGCGGGSVLDLAKAAACLIPNANGHSAAEFFEGTEKPRPIEKDPLPFVAVPTTAGTGSEATRNSVLSWPERKLKRSLRDPRMVARIALLDPELTVPVPPETTAHTGMDALTQLIESFVCRRANPATDALALSAVPRVFRSLPRAFRDGSDREARSDMSYAAFASGVCLANAGLGVAHAVAPALGLLYGVPHGKACAVLLPFALEVNREAARAKLAALGRLLDPEARTAEKAVEALIGKVRELNSLFGIPSRLGALGVKREAVPELAAYSSSNSLKANARPLGREEVAELLAEIV